VYGSLTFKTRTNYLQGEYNTTIEEHDAIVGYAGGNRAITWDEGLGGYGGGVLHGQWADGGTAIQISDRSFKENIKPLQMSFPEGMTQNDLLRELRPVTFQYKKDTAPEPRFGFVAQEMEKTLPQLVRRLPKQEDKMGLVYMDMLAFLTAMLQGLTKEMGVLVPRLASIEGRIAQRKTWKKARRARGAAASTGGDMSAHDHRRQKASIV
jgi:hypothetical protein